jgi:type II secretion system protein J
MGDFWNRVRMHARHGMTFVELLVAMAIAVLLALVILSVYHAVLSTIEYQRDLREGHGGAVAALEVISRDLACTVGAGGEEETVFLLGGDESAGIPASSILFHTAVPVPDQAEPGRHEVHRLSYRVEATDDSGYTLVRESTPLEREAGIGETAVSRMLEGITGFRVTASDGREWRKRWSGEESGGVPRAVRVGLTFRRGDLERTLSSEVFIPAGHTISSVGRGTGH